MVPKVGGEDLEAAISRFRSALGADLRSLKPSADRTRLHAILRELGQMNVLLPILNSCRVLVESLGVERRRSPAGAPESRPQERVAEQLLVDLCPWLSKRVMQSDVFDLLARYRSRPPAAADDTEWNAKFLIKLSWLMRQFPSEAFASLEQYTNIRNYLTVAVDGFLDVAAVSTSACADTGIRS